MRFRVPLLAAFTWAIAVSQILAADAVSVVEDPGRVPPAAAVTNNSTPNFVTRISVETTVVVVTVDTAVAAANEVSAFTPKPVPLSDTAQEFTLDPTGSTDANVSAFTINLEASLHDADTLEDVEFFGTLASTTTLPKFELSASSVHHLENLPTISLPCPTGCPRPTQSLRIIGTVTTTITPSPTSTLAAAKSWDEMTWLPIATFIFIVYDLISAAVLLWMWASGNCGILRREPRPAPRPRPSHDHPDDERIMLMLDEQTARLGPPATEAEARRRTRNRERTIENLRAQRRLAEYLGD